MCILWASVCHIKRVHYIKHMLFEQDCVKFHGCIAWLIFFWKQLCGFPDIVRVKKKNRRFLSSCWWHYELATWSPIAVWHVWCYHAEGNIPSLIFSQLQNFKYWWDVKWETLFYFFVCLRGYCTPGPYFWRLCAFSQQIKQLRTKYPMDLVRNVPRNSKITVLLQ